MSAPRRYSPLLRGLTVLLHGSLIVWLLAHAGTPLQWLSLVLLLLPLPGLIRGRLRTYGWASMLMTFYCAFWASDLWMPSPGSHSLVLALLSAADFSAMLLYARLVRREAPVPPARTAG